MPGLKPLAEDLGIVLCDPNVFFGLGCRYLDPRFFGPYQYAWIHLDSSGSVLIS